MRAASIIAILGCLYSAQLWSDVSFHYDFFSKNNQLPLHSVYVQNDRVRVDVKSTRPTTVMIDLQTGDIVQLNSQQRKYFNTSAEMLNQYVSLYRQNKPLMQMLISQSLQHFAPTQQNQVLQLLKYIEQPPASAGFTLQPTRRKDQVLGVPCQILSMTHGNQVVRDICIADYRDMGLPTNDERSLEKMKRMIQAFRQSGSQSPQDLISILANNVHNIRGIPMQVVNYNPQGKIMNVVKLTSISLRKLPAQTYQIPAHFQQQLMPSL